jgi:hypothetical protein
MISYALIIPRAGCYRMIQHTPIFSLLPAYQVDLADGQWREFRASLPLLWAAVGGSFVLSRLYAAYAARAGKGGQGRVVLDLAFGLSLLLLQHGRHALIVLGLLALSYAVGLLTKDTRYRVGAAWGMGIFTILLKESYRIRRIYPEFYYQYLNIFFDQRYSGIYSWHLPANFLVLRMISFACDDHWSSRALSDKKKSDGVSNGVSNEVSNDGSSDSAKEKEIIGERGG